MTDTGSTVIVDEANKAFDETVSKALLTEANKVGLKIEDEVPTINKIKMLFMQRNNHCQKLMQLVIKYSI